jgi:hypothetical protein
MSDDKKLRLEEGYSSYAGYYLSLKRGNEWIAYIHLDDATNPEASYEIITKMMDLYNAEQ